MRNYPRDMKTALSLFACFWAASAVLTMPLQRIRTFTLDDQHRQTRLYSFPKQKITVMTVADYQGSRQLEPWVSYVYHRFGTRIDIDGVADVSTVPTLLRDALRLTVRGQMKRSIMLDWNGHVVRQFAYQANVANVYVLDVDGSVRSHFKGAANPAALRELSNTLETILSESM